MTRLKLKTVEEASRIEIQAQAANPFAGAYSYGWSEHLTRGNTPWDDAESELRDRWSSVPCNAGLSWDQAREAIRDGWEHVSTSKH